MKIAFFGTPEFTTQFLDVLVAHDFTPSLIVTNPDAPVGRGMVLTSPAPKLWADAHTIKCIQPEKLTDDIVNTLAQEHWDLFVVIAYGQIIPERLITLPVFGTINVHYSLLPKYRGASPVESALLHGDTETGVCIQSMRLKLDTGPIITEKKVAIAPDDTTITLRDKLNKEACLMLPEVITSLFNKTAIFTEQSQEGVSITRKIKKELGNLDLISDEQTKWHIFQSIGDRGWVYMTTLRNDKPTRIKITKAHFVDNKFIIDEIIPENGKRQPFHSFA